MRRFEELQAFVAVVETGSFTAAADRLDAAKSAISRRVSSLEDRLGVTTPSDETVVVRAVGDGTAADVRAARLFPPPTETNFSAAWLTGRQHECEAAAAAFARS